MRSRVHGLPDAVSGPRQQHQKALVCGHKLHHRCAVPVASRDRRRTSEVMGSYIQPLRAPNTRVRARPQTHVHPRPRRPIDAHVLTWLRHGMRVRAGAREVAAAVAADITTITASVAIAAIATAVTVAARRSHHRRVGVQRGSVAGARAAWAARRGGARAGSSGGAQQCFTRRYARDSACARRVTRAAARSFAARPGPAATRPECVCAGAGGGSGSCAAPAASPPRAPPYSSLAQLAQRRPSSRRAAARSAPSRSIRRCAPRPPQCQSVPRDPQPTNAYSHTARPERWCVRRPQAAVEAPPMQQPTVGAASASAPPNAVRARRHGPPTPRCCVLV